MILVLLVCPELLLKIILHIINAATKLTVGYHGIILRRMQPKNLVVQIFLHNANSFNLSKYIMSNTNHNLQKEIWITSKWRPAMAWMYMVVCIFDFIIFPIMWSIVQIIFNGKVDSPWTPITLIGAGLFHMAMGAIVGVTAWGRTREKLNTSLYENTDMSDNVGTPSSFTTAGPHQQ